MIECNEASPPIVNPESPKGSSQLDLGQIALQADMAVVTADDAYGEICMDVEPIECFDDTGPLTTQHLNLASQWSELCSTDSSTCLTIDLDQSIGKVPSSLGSPLLAISTP